MSLTWCTRFDSKFLKLTCLRDEDVCYAHDLSFCNGLACRGCVFNALIEPRIETLEWLVGVEGLPQLGVIIPEVHGQYPVVVAINMDD